MRFPEAAFVPSLGLSNKGAESVSELELNDVQVASSKGPPTEDELMLGTIWSEVSKLYGHGNELLALASSTDGTTLASSCRAAAGVDATIIIWNTKEWKETQRLNHHRLSVTQMEFSYCDKFLLSVSRDRSWAVFHKESDLGWTILAHSGTLGKETQHSRIIWSCCWVSESLAFVTGSRDKTAVIWAPVCDVGGRVTSWQRGKTLRAEEEVTAVAVERLAEDKLLLAIGSINTLQRIIAEDNI